MDRINVLLVDDHVTIRTALKLLLMSEGEIKVVAEGGTGLEGLKLLESNRKFDVIVSDVTMPEMDGIEFAKIATEKYQSKVLMLSMHMDEKYIKEAVAAGAKGYIFKHSSGFEIIEAVKAVHDGGMYFSKEEEGVI